MASQMSCPRKKSFVPFYGIKWKQEQFINDIFIRKCLIMDNDDYLIPKNEKKHQMDLPETHLQGVQRKMHHHNNVP